MVQSSIGCKTDQSNMYSKVFHAAETSNGPEMLSRLHRVPNGDLVAVEDRYHRASISTDTTY